ncbi:uncharacterized protein ASCRUDRAFT_10749 [Ascoidea rubescens DSM 1968]|uniref:Uncharacterized protein n=1 Tax=Ascoidea rubescens DSM 1968 TaxID=1344418 RepID=A0A1D2V867_9ASCO|nr:hypothetical protein ASCRUDRAFT_10749 [Ascoidea rubescens DSM 1968]ODV57800.1 hypothetical protein ASCRUDRAFT_10749 [Ascoidea rubescens DSM 1968]
MEISTLNLRQSIIFEFRKQFRIIKSKKSLKKTTKKIRSSIWDNQIDRDWTTQIKWENLLSNYTKHYQRDNRNQVSIHKTILYPILHFPKPIFQKIIALLTGNDIKSIIHYQQIKSKSQPQECECGHIDKSALHQLQKCPLRYKERENILPKKIIKEPPKIGKENLPKVVKFFDPIK